MPPPTGRLTITWLPFPLSVTFSRVPKLAAAQELGAPPACGGHTQREGEAEVVRIVAEFAEIDPEAIRIVRACRSCGSDRHGKPHVIAPTAATALHVSVSRAAGLTVVAVTDLGPVGIDVEADRPDVEDLPAWVCTESLVKSTGHGLTIDPATIADDRWTSDLDAPEGYVAAVTILTATPPSTITNPAAPAD